MVVVETPFVLAHRDARGATLATVEIHSHAYFRYGVCSVLSAPSAHSSLLSTQYQSLQQAAHELGTKLTGAPADAATFFEAFCIADFGPERLGLDSVESRKGGVTARAFYSLETALCPVCIANGDHAEGGFWAPCGLLTPLVAVGVAASVAHASIADEMQKRRHFPTVFHEQGELTHRGRARPKRPREPADEREGGGPSQTNPRPKHRYRFKPGTVVFVPGDDAPYRIGGVVLNDPSHPGQKVLELERVLVEGEATAAAAHGPLRVLGTQTRPIQERFPELWDGSPPGGPERGVLVAAVKQQAAAAGRATGGTRVSELDVFHQVLGREEPSAAFSATPPAQTGAQTGGRATSSAQTGAAPLEHVAGEEEGLGELEDGELR